MNLKSLLEQAVFEVSGRVSPPLEPETTLSQLGLDSVATLELVATFEEKVGVRLSDDELASIQTVGQLTSAIDRRLKPADRVAA